MTTTRSTCRRALVAAPAAIGLGLISSLVVAAPAAAVDHVAGTAAEFFEAIDLANLNPGPDEITLTAGFPLTADTPMITDDLIIHGGSVTIDANGHRAIASYEADLTVHDLTIVGADLGFYLGVGTIDLTDVTVEDSRQGFYGTEVDATLLRVDIVRSTQANAVFHNTEPGNDISITDSDFLDSEEEYGLFINQHGPANSVELLEVDANGNAGGGVYLHLEGASTATITDSDADDNDVHGFVLVATGDSSITTDDAEGDENGSSGISAETHDSASIVVGSASPGRNGTGVSLWNSSADATLRYDGGLLTQNGTGVSAGVANGGTITIAGAAPQGNEVGLRIRQHLADATGGTVLVDRMWSFANTARGIEIPSDARNVDVRIADSRISENGGTAAGAGLIASLVNSSLTIERTTIADNETTAAVAGLLVEADETSTVAIVNSTIARNTAADRPAMHIGSANDVDGIQLHHLTVADNTGTGDNVVADSLVSSERTVISHSIFAAAENALRLDVWPAQLDFNLVQSVGDFAADDLAAGTGNLVGIAPQLQALTANGGFGPTMLPAPGSPAIDAGDPAFAAPPATDQRGESRVQGARIDIGAVEVAASLPATGATTSWLIPVAIGLLVLGAIAVVITILRRRKRG